MQTALHNDAFGELLELKCELLPVHSELCVCAGLSSAHPRLFRLKCCIVLLLGRGRTAPTAAFSVCPEHTDPYWARFSLSLSVCVRWLFWCLIPGQPLSFTSTEGKWRAFKPAFTIPKEGARSRMECWNFQKLLLIDVFVSVSWRRLGWRRLMTNWKSFIVDILVFQHDMTWHNC